MKEKKIEWIKEWLSKAEKDLKVAEDYKNDPLMTDIVCFHAQQAAEKYLTGLK